ncbi:MAG: OmpA family protein [Opitutales bacterium]|nr:OmpA family protein [Opitutales bacterium]
MKKTVTTQGKRTLILGVTACFAAIPVLYLTTGCESTKPSNRYQSTYNAPRTNELVGPAGAQGPSGPAGIQGETGARGAPGAGIVGATGDRGQAGPTGQQGYTGQRGPAGSVVVGKQGATGIAGPAGAQGERGETGQTGSSTIGMTGARGPTGAVGDRGLQGETGMRGDTLVGPTGATGRTGDAGLQGIVGKSGVEGAGVTGPTGAAGAVGAQGDQGHRGDAGISGTAGVVLAWTPYRDFWFDYNSSDLNGDARLMVTGIVNYLKNNPTLEIGLDGNTNPNSSNPQNRSMATRRIEAIRIALKNAGISDNRIQVGAFGDAMQYRDRRVEVLLRTIPVLDNTVKTASHSNN